MSADNSLKGIQENQNYDVFGHQMPITELHRNYSMKETWDQDPIKQRK